MEDLLFDVNEGVGENELITANKVKETSTRNVRIEDSRAILSSCVANVGLFFKQSNRRNYCQ